MPQMASAAEHYQSTMGRIIFGDENSRGVEDYFKLAAGKIIGTKLKSWDQVMEAESIAAQVQDEKMATELRKEAAAARKMLRAQERETALGEKQERASAKESRVEVARQLGIPEGVARKEPKGSMRL